MKMKETEKNKKYLDLAREQKMPWNMKMTMKLIVVGALVPKGWETKKRWIRNQKDRNQKNHSIDKID